MKTIEERVKEIISEQLNVQTEDILVTSDPHNDFGMDSLDDVELVMALEDEFEMEISDEEADANRTVQQMIDFFTNQPKASK